MSTFFKKKKEEDIVEFKQIDPDTLEEIKDTEVSAKTELEVMLEQMQKDLENKKNSIEEGVRAFEQAQEEQAIISYKELLNATRKQEEADKKEEMQQLISTLALDQEEEGEEEFIEYLSDPKEEIKKFKTTEFISPIYGKMKVEFDYPTVPNAGKPEKMPEPEEFEKIALDPEFEAEIEIPLREEYRKQLEEPIPEFKHARCGKHELEETLNIQPLSDEIKKNDDFLKALKEFRKKLEE